MKRIRGKEVSTTLEFIYADGSIQFTIRQDGSAVKKTATVDAVQFSHKLEEELRQA